jgi:histidinol phosphatase-like enzyme
MLLKAKEYYPDIDFSKSIMVGDSPGDMALADQLDIIKVRILNDQFEFDNQDFTYSDLSSFVIALSN